MMRSRRPFARFAVAALLLSCASSGRVHVTATAQRFVALSAGGDVTCGLTADGTAWCWGDNDLGQLGAATDATCEGSGASHSCSAVPVRVQGAPPLVAIGAGALHACGLTGEGAPWCWGFGGFGQLGRQAPEQCTSHRIEGAAIPCSRKAMAVQTDVPFWSIAVGGAHTCALTAEGVAWCWGLDDGNQLGATDPPDACQSLGNGQPVRLPCSFRPLPVRTETHFTELSARGPLACALDPAGGVWCWGGGIGLPARQDVSQAFRAIAAGLDKACALDPDGVAWCWGTFALGPAAHVTHGPRNMATFGKTEPRPADLQAWTFRSLTIGAEHVCGLRGDGSIACWGDNREGQLGVFSGAFLGTVGVGWQGSNEPVRTGAEGSFRAVAAGDAHACALRSDGAVACWGRNQHGQLGSSSAD